MEVDSMQIEAQIDRGLEDFPLTGLITHWPWSLTVKAVMRHAPDKGKLRWLWVVVHGFLLVLLLLVLLLLHPRAFPGAPMLCYQFVICLCGVMSLPVGWQAIAGLRCLACPLYIIRKTMKEIKHNWCHLPIGRVDHLLSMVFPLWLSKKNGVPASFGSNEHSCGSSRVPAPDPQTTFHVTYVGTAWGQSLQRRLVLWLWVIGRDRRR